MKNYFLVLVLNFVIFPTIGQYQFPLDAMEQLKMKTKEYIGFIKSTPSFEICMEVSERGKGREKETRKSVFAKREGLAIINDGNTTFVIDDSLTVLVNEENKQLFLKIGNPNSEESGLWIEDFFGNIDSVMYYAESVKYSIDNGIRFDIRILPQNMYVFNNLMYQRVFYSENKILPDSIIQGYYDGTEFEVITVFKSVSDGISKSTPHGSTSSYFFDEKGKLLPKYSKYSLKLI